MSARVVLAAVFRCSSWKSKHTVSLSACASGPQMTPLETEAIIAGVPGLCLRRSIMSAPKRLRS